MKRHIIYRLCTLLIFLSYISVYSQKGKLFDKIKKEDYNSAYNDIEKTLSKNPSDIEANYAKAILLSLTQNQNQNIDSAYYALFIAKKSLNKEKNKEKWIKKGISYQSIRKLNDSICKYAMLKAKKENTIEAYNHFSKYYQRSIPLFINQNKDNWSKKAWENTEKKDTEEGYKEFYNKFKNSPISKIAYKRIIDKELKTAIESKNSLEELKNFIKKYPNTEQTKHAKDILSRKVYYESVKPGNWNSYKDYIIANPGEKNINKAEDSIYSIYKETNNKDILSFASEYFTGKHRSEMIHNYFYYYTGDGEMVSLKNFEDNYKNDIDENIYNKQYKICKLKDSLNLENTYFDPGKTKQFNHYIYAASDKDNAFVAVQRMIASNIKRKEWAAAIAVVKQYIPVLKGKNNKKNIKNLLYLLQEQSDKNIHFKSLGNNINTKGREYLPVPSIDGKKLYFIGQDRIDNLAPKQEDAYVCEKTAKGGWSKPKLIKEICSPKNHEGIEGTSADGTTLFMFINGTLYSIDKEKNGWGKPIMLPSEINSGEWQAGIQETSDGKAYIFSAVRSDGYDTYKKNDIYYHGNLNYHSDIYVVYKGSDGNLIGPINLGPTINTRYCDRNPYLHPDMKTLYFSSEGHGGLGKMDVFVSHRLSDTCWTCWSEPINLGKDINGPENDMFYKISTDGSTAYLTKGAIGKENIYQLNLPKKLRPNPVACIKGKLLDSKGNPIETNIIWEDLKTGKQIGEAKTDPEDGSFFFVLPMGKLYGFYNQKDGYISISNNIDLRGKNKNINLTLPTTNIYSFEELEEKNKTILLKNLFFDLSNNKLLPESEPELDRLAKTIIDNNLKIEINEHLYNIKYNSNNQNVDIEIAENIKNYLIKKGCNTEMISTRNYGEVKESLANNRSRTNKIKRLDIYIKIIK